MDVRGGLADVLDALQRVDGVGAAKDAGSEHDGEGVGWHPVSLLLQGDPETHHSVILLILMWIFTECDTHSQQTQQTGRQETETANAVRTWNHCSDTQNIIISKVSF